MKRHGFFFVACALLTSAVGCAVAPAESGDQEETNTAADELRVGSLVGSYETSDLVFGFDKLSLRDDGTYQAISTRFCVRAPCPPGVETGRYSVRVTEGARPTSLVLMPFAGAAQLFSLRVTPSGFVLSQRNLSARFDRACVVTGCGGTVCAETDVVTTCQFRPEDVCYQGATCARNPGGRCGWVRTPELAACIAATAGRTCPRDGFVNCMPSIGRPRPAFCEPSYRAWITANCPGVQFAD